MESGTIRTTRKWLLTERGLWDAWSATLDGYRRSLGIGRDEAAHMADADHGVDMEELKARQGEIMGAMFRQRNIQRKADIQDLKDKAKARAKVGKEIAVAHRDGMLVIAAGDDGEAESMLKRRRDAWWKKKGAQRAGVDDYDAIRWVADVFADEKVGHADAPSEMSWSLLIFARSSPSNTATFWGTLFKSIALPKRTDIEDMQRNRASVSHIEEAIAAATKMYDVAVKGG